MTVTPPLRAQTAERQTRARGDLVAMRFRHSRHFVDRRTGAGKTRSNVSGPLTINGWSLWSGTCASMLQEDSWHPYSLNYGSSSLPS